MLLPMPFMGRGTIARRGSGGGVGAPGVYPSTMLCMVPLPSEAGEELK